MEELVTKSQRYEQERAIAQFRHEAGVRAVLLWLGHRRDELNRQWQGLAGDDLIRLQGAAQEVSRLRDLIEHGPKIKPMEGTNG